MAYQKIFKRYELKYLLTREQRERILGQLQSYMQPDKYGLTTIRNLYFDTPSYRLIRRSIEKPVYKEKLRIRSYGAAKLQEPVFVELKKKYDHVVYKRRLEMTQEKALNWLAGDGFLIPDSQIGRELEYFRTYYGSLQPTVFLSYDRTAYYCKGENSLRITFDENIRCRQKDLTLSGTAEGKLIMPEDLCLMEVKTMGGMPLWLSALLTQEKLYKTSFSKYGTAYEIEIFPQLKGVAL